MSNKKLVSWDSTDLESILEYSVGEPEYLQIVNGLRKISDIINWDELREYMREQNEIYCKENGLCPICRSELKEFTEYVEGIVCERYSACPNHCE